MVEVDLRTAVIVPVAGLPDAVDRCRERTCTFKPSAGVPAHITLAFPFVPAAEATGALVSGLSGLFGQIERFGFELVELRRFPEVLFLAPEPPKPFVQLSEALAERFPACAASVHAFGDVVPHLTVAEGDLDALDAAAAGEIGPLLPIRASCDSAVLLAETSAHPARWVVRAQLPLKSADPSIQA